MARPAVPHLTREAQPPGRVPPAVGRIVTVDGSIEPDEAGLTSCHEHVLMDMSGWPAPRDAEAQAFAELPITMATLGRLRRNTWRFHADNYRLDDVRLAIQELQAFAGAGGRTIVELTPVGLVPRPGELRRIARSARIHVVAGCGWYLAGMVPPETRRLGVERLAALLLRDVEEGIGSSDVRPGVIGELGTSEVIAPFEWRVLRAAAIVARRTGLAIIVHTHPWARNGLSVVRCLLDAGVPPTRIAIGHLDHGPMDLGYHRELAATGVYLAFDGFGKEWYVDDLRTWFPRDYERLAAMRELIHAGHLLSIVLGCDVCLKIQLTRYGGWGYAHLPGTVPGLMRALGFSDVEIRTLLVDNPRELLTVVPPLE